jgi:hypothetical protein
MNRVITGYDENGNPEVIRQGEPPVVIRAGRIPLFSSPACRTTGRTARLSRP